MKTLRLSLLMPVLMLTSTAIVCMAPAAKSAGPAELPFVKLDVKKIIDPQDPSKSQSTEWKDAMESFQKNLEKEQKPLQDLQAKVQAKQVELEAKNKKGEKLTEAEQSSIMTMFQELQSKTQQLQAKAEAQFAQLTKEFQEKIQTTAEVVAGGKPVLYSDVFISSKGVKDITAETIAELNKKHAADKRAKKMTSETPKAKA